MLVALLSASAVALLAYRARLLSPSGAVAATLVGAATFMAGFDWVLVLLVFFISSSGLSVWRGAERDRLTSSLLEKGGRRDAAQVLANGAVFAVAAGLFNGTGDHAFQAIAAGAIATAMSDTWSTEVGTIVGGTPRVILGGGEVPPGTSGGLTLAGTAAAFGGAFLAAFAALTMDWQPSFPVIAGAGVVGSLVDSLLGATVQERRWCDVCGQATERRVHTCGTRTSHRGGIHGWNNDMVNFTSTLAGATVAWALT